MADTMKFEAALARLEEIVTALEKGSADLDESLSLYEEGIRLIKFCNERLDTAEQRVMLVRGKDKDFTLEPFGGEEA